MKNTTIRRLFLTLLIALGLLCFVPAARTQAASKKVSYTYETTTKKYKASDGTVVLKATYKYVKIKGSSSAVKKMNKTIAKDKTNFFKEAKSYLETAQEYYEGWKNYLYTNGDFTPSTISVKSKVTFNKNGVVSIKESYNSYFYGAAHGYFYTYGQTFKISTGKKLTLNQVISGSNSSDKKKLVAAFKKMQAKNPGMYWDDALDTVQNTTMKTANFYLSSKYAVVCYPPYELASFAAGEVYVKVKHTYR